MIPTPPRTLQRTTLPQSVPAGRASTCHATRALVFRSWTIVVGTLVVTFSPSPSPAFPLGTIVTHNGSLDSSPPGTGEAPSILFTYGVATLGPHCAEYLEPTTHEVRYRYSVDSPTVMYARAVFFNQSSVPWSGFEILLEGADFAGYPLDGPEQAPADNPVLYWDPIDPIEPDQAGPETILLDPVHPLNPLSLSGSAIARFNDQGSGFTDSLLTITFGHPLNVNRNFSLWYNIIPSPGAAGATEFTVRLTPIPVPEPASLILAALAATPTLLRRRRTG